MKLEGSRTFIRPSGSLDASYVLVGEQPGIQEVRTGEVFKGPAGQELDIELNMADISRSDSYLTNTIKDLDKHKDFYIQLYKGSKLLEQPIVTNLGKRHLEFLRWELQQTSARCFIALGAISLFALTGRTGITKWRGSLLECSLVPGRKVVPAFHPATVIRPKNNFLNRHLIAYDMKKAREYIENIYVPTYRKVSIEPTFLEATQFLSFCYRKGLEGNKISYDIELLQDRETDEIGCISFATELQGMSIPFVRGPDDYFTTQQEMQIWKMICSILEDERIKKVAQNSVFDCHYMLRRFGMRVKNLDDTMIAQQIYMPDYPKGLDFITSIWTDHPYYKADGKRYFKGLSTDQKKFWAYNCTDSLICDEALPKQLSAIKEQGNLQTYFRQCKVIEPCVYMMEKGIKVDVVKMQEYGRKVAMEIDSTWEELNEMAGQELNPNSYGATGDLHQYFCVKKGIKPYRKRRTNGKWTPSYDDIAMVRLKRRGFKEADLILKIRRMRKQYSTYLDMKKVDEDGRSRCSYNPVGTRYSRMSSSKNIFGTGGNHQNWPHHLQEFLIPDEGYVYYAFDYSQAENRIVAYVGGVLVMIEAFESGRDTHSITAGMIFKKHPDQVTREDFTCSLGDGSHSERYWGKKANHGLDYDQQYRAFAIQNEITENEGKLVYDGFHTLYPEIKNSYYVDVQKQLRKNRTLTNLMGRKTKFLDDITGDRRQDTFREAYSCIPQGTVGDMINEYGVEYIYYNTDEFKNVELLRQVHDEVGIQIPLTLSFSDHANIITKIKRNMERVLKTATGRRFTIPVGVSIGHTLNKESCTELKTITPKILEETWEEN